MFDFYYPEIIYNEPSFWYSLFITLIGTFLGFLGAFYLVNIGQKKQKTIDNQKKIDDHNNRLTYFTLLIDNALKTTEEQIDNFEILAKEINTNPLEINLLPMVASVDIDRLQKMDTVEIFNAYIELIPNSNEKLKDYKNIFNSVDFISLRIKQGFNSNEKHIGFLHKDQLFVKENIEGLSDELIREIKQLENNIKDFNNNPDYRFLTKSHSKYYALVESEAKLDEIETDFLIPFGKELNQNHSKKPFFFNLYVYTSKSIIRLNHIKMNSVIFVSEIFDIRKEMKKPINKLIEINDKIKLATTSNIGHLADGAKNEDISTK